MEVSLVQGAGVCQAGAVMGTEMGGTGGLTEGARQAQEECRDGQGQNVSIEDWRHTACQGVLSREDLCCRKIILVACEQPRVKPKLSGYT